MQKKFSGGNILTYLYSLCPHNNNHFCPRQILLFWRDNVPFKTLNPQPTVLEICLLIYLLCKFRDHTLMAKFWDPLLFRTLPTYGAVDINVNIYMQKLVSHQLGTKISS